VLAIAPESLEQFRAFCERERCPFAVIGTATEERQLVLHDPAAQAADQKLPVDMPMSVLLGKPPKMHRDVQTVQRPLQPIDLTGVPLQKAVIDVLSHPTVASKRFLVTIGDRTVGGLTHRDQMVGPWQVPVADCAVTLGRLQGLCRRGHGHGRAHAAGRPGRPGLGPHGGGRSHHQPAGRAHRTAARQAQRQLDGRLR
jgi:phosphoribosylformylglycinamidine synthase